jgi:hypothetical protein
MCYIPFSHAPILQICGHLNVRTPFGEAKSCGEPLCVTDKLGCPAGEGKLQNTNTKINSDLYFSRDEYSHSTRAENILRAE